jgi:hypothetical protein
MSKAPDTPSIPTALMMGPDGMVYDVSTGMPADAPGAGDASRPADEVVGNGESHYAPPGRPVNLCFSYAPPGRGGTPSICFSYAPPGRGGTPSICFSYAQEHPGEAGPCSHS